MSDTTDAGMQQTPGAPAEISNDQAQGILQLLALLWDLFQKFRRPQGRPAAMNEEHKAHMGMVESKLREHDLLDEAGNVKWDKLGGKPKVN